MTLHDIMASLKDLEILVNNNQREEALTFVRDMLSKYAPLREVYAASYLDEMPIEEYFHFYDNIMPNNDYAEFFTMLDCVEDDIVHFDDLEDALGDLYCAMEILEAQLGEVLSFRSLYVYLYVMYYSVCAMRSADLLSAWFDDLNNKSINLYEKYASKPFWSEESQCFIDPEETVYDLLFSEMDFLKTDFEMDKNRETKDWETYKIRLSTILQLLERIK